MAELSVSDSQDSAAFLMLSRRTCKLWANCLGLCVAIVPALKAHSGILGNEGGALDPSQAPVFPLPGYHTCCESPQNFSSGPPPGFHTGNKTAGKGYS